MFSEHIEGYIQKVCNLTAYKKLFFYNSFKTIHLDKKYIKIISGTLAHLGEPNINSISHFDYLKFSFKHVAYQNFPFLSKIENNAVIDPDLTDDEDSDFS